MIGDLAHMSLAEYVWTTARQATETHYFNTFLSSERLLGANFCLYLIDQI